MLCSAPAAIRAKTGERCSWSIRIRVDQSALTTLTLGKRHILMATFREEDVAAGGAVTDAVQLRQLVSEGSGGLEK